ncbi:MAG TPA: hypothetical protein VK689_20325, partial [Armatimonadota bacterium]|nr:hypothetical protein [Armatimonadota bacterium]
MILMRYTLLPVLLVAALLAVVTPVPGWGANPAISVRAREVTLTEAAAILEKAAGVPIEVRLLIGPPFPAPEVDPELRTSFDWSASTLGKALRELADRYGLHASARPGGGYVLMSVFGGARLKPYHPVGAVERDGFRIGLRSLTVQRERGAAQGGGSLSLGLWVDVLTGDVESIAGIENVTASDDRGGILLTTQSSSGSTLLPDGWGSTFRLDPPHPGATRLKWIEGDLILYRRLKPFRFEIPLPLPESGATRQRGEVEVEVVTIVPGKAEVPTDPIERQHAGPTVQVRLRHPRGFTIDSAGSSWGAAPLLAGISGRTYAPNAMSGGDRGSTEQILSNEFDYRFPAIDEPLAAVVFNLVQKEDPETQVYFRLQ